MLKERCKSLKYKEGDKFKKDVKDERACNVKVGEFDVKSWVGINCRVPQIENEELLCTNCKLQTASVSAYDCDMWVETVEKRAGTAGWKACPEYIEWLYDS